MSGSGLFSQLVFGLGYLLTGIVSKLIAFYPTLYPVVLWLPAGVALAGLLLHGPRIAPGLLAGALLVNFYNIPDPDWWRTPWEFIGLPVAVSLGGVAQAWLGAWLVRRFAQVETLLIDGGQILRLLLLGGPLACLLNAGIGAAALVVRGVIPLESAPFTGLTWWVGDALGVMLLTPLFLLWSDRFGRQKEEGGRERRLPILLALGCTLLVAEGGFLLQSSQEQQESRQNLLSDAREFAQRLQRQISQQVDLMSGLAGFLGSVEHVTRSRFSGYARRLLESHPEIQALEWAPRVAGRERAVVEGEGRLWFPGYHFTERSPEGRLVRAGERDEHVPVHLVEPYPGNETALGFDLWSHPVRRESLKKAALSGNITASPPIDLVQDKEGQRGVLLLLPVWKESRASEILGYAVGVFRLSALVAQTRIGLESFPFHVLIQDAHPEGSGESQLYSNATGAELARLARQPGQDREEILQEGRWLDDMTQQVIVGDRAWEIRYALNARGFARFMGGIHAWMVLVAGLLFGVMVQYLVLSLTGRTLLVSRQVRERTTALEESRLSLGRSEAIIRAMVETASNAIITMGEDKRIMLFNQAAERMFGYRAEEVRGENIRLIMPSPVREEHDACVDHYLQTGQPRVIGSWREVSGLRRDGTVFPVELAVSEVRVEERRFFLGILTDISRRKAAEEELLLARKVFENAGEAIIITDARGIILDANPAFQMITGFSREETVGQTPAITKSGRHDPAFYQEMWLALNLHGGWEGEVWDRRKNGEVFPKWLSINAIRGPEGQIRNFVGIFVDITSRKETEQKLERLAFYDPLTGLPNRLLFRDRLSQELLACRRRNVQLGLLFIDLDRFKWVNDTLGHASGDELLREISQRLLGCVRRQDTVARLGGDEFTVILSGLEHPEAASGVAQKIIGVVCEPVRINEQDVHVGASVGIAVFPQDADDLEMLIKNADMAMYQAKDAGRNTFRFFSRELHAQAFDRIAMEDDLHKALDRDELLLYHQPKVCLKTGCLQGMEALVRWNKPEHGMVNPGQFIPLAEETGLILPMGAWILRTACQQNAAWSEAIGKTLKCAVNLSGRQFQQKNLAEEVKGVLEYYNLPPESLELEITESIVMGNVDEAIAIMRRLRDLGLSLAIDDFGTGYSSLNYLKRFPISTLKIDQSFVRELPDVRENRAIVDAIISLARSLDLGVVAEGVETVAQLEYLHQSGCEEVQGYLLSRPLGLKEFDALLRVEGAGVLPCSAWPVRWL
ncbi:MAG: EAL domain-containing protein [Magnetococcales bacterium]|nr:EAL domain-containing protein [Magnetococcales bacterium]